jgi:hypothetical protein
MSADNSQNNNKLERFIIRNKHEFSNIWNYWCRIYYNTYPEQYIFNDITRHYSLIINCHDGPFVINYIDSIVLNNAGYKDIYYDLCTNPIQSTIRYILIYMFYRHYYNPSVNIREKIRYNIDSILDESFDNNHLKIRTSDNKIITISIDRIDAISAASVYH